MKRFPGDWQMPLTPWLGPWGAAGPHRGCPMAGREMKDPLGEGMGAPRQRQGWRYRSKQQVQVRFTVKGKTNY